MPYQRLGLYNGLFYIGEVGEVFSDLHLHARISLNAFIAFFDLLLHLLTFPVIVFHMQRTLTLILVFHED